jgi:AraC-like DNA-binding protein
MNELRRLLVEEGLTYNDVIQRLKLSERTFYRLLNALFEEDRRLLAENIDDTEFLNQMAICRDRLLEQRRDLLEMAKDPGVDDQARINAHHLVAEIAAAILRLYEGGPGQLAARHRFPRTSLTGPGTTGAKLVLKKKEEQKEEYDELDYEEGEDPSTSQAGIGRTRSSTITTTTTLPTKEEKEQEETWR